MWMYYSLLGFIKAMEGKIRFPILTGGCWETTEPISEKEIQEAMEIFKSNVKRTIKIKKIILKNGRVFDYIEP